MRLVIFICRKDIGTLRVAAERHEFLRGVWGILGAQITCQAPRKVPPTQAPTAQAVFALKVFSNPRINAHRAMNQEFGIYFIYFFLFPCNQKRTMTRFHHQLPLPPLRDGVPMGRAPKDEPLRRDSGAEDGQTDGREPGALYEEQTWKGRGVWFWH